VVTGRKYLVWPKVNPFILRQAQDERIYFYKALLSKAEGALLSKVEEFLIEELEFECTHSISHRANQAMAVLNFIKRNA